MAATDEYAAPPPQPEPEAEAQEHPEWGYGQLPEEHKEPTAASGEPVSLPPPLPTAAEAQVIGPGPFEDSGPKVDADDKGVTAGYFAPRMLRIVTLDGILIWFSILAMARWFDKDDFKGSKDIDKDMREVYNMHAAGILFMFLGFVFILGHEIVQWYGMERKRIVDFVFSAFIVGGAVLYCIGGMMYAQWWNDHYDDAFEDSHESLGGIAFFESLYISVVAVLFAADVSFDVLGISQRLRIYFGLVVLSTFVSLLLFFCYSIVSGDSDWDDATHSESQTGAVAAGWFFILVASAFYLMIEFAEICCKWSEGAKSGIGKWQQVMINVLTGIYFFGSFLVWAGMWAYGNKISNKFVDNTSPFVAYYVGYGFFVMFMGAFVATDISWAQYGCGGALSELSAKIQGGSKAGAKKEGGLGEPLVAGNPEYQD